jgi:hypothetical protein
MAPHGVEDGVVMCLEGNEVLVVVQAHVPVLCCDGQHASIARVVAGEGHDVMARLTVQSGGLDARCVVPVNRLEDSPCLAFQESLQQRVPFRWLEAELDTLMNGLILDKGILLHVIIGDRR